MVSASRRGVALVLALFVLLALATTAVGLLFVSTQEVLIAHGGEQTARARWAAESAVRATLGSWSTRRFRTLRTGEVVRLAPSLADADLAAGAAVTVERLAGRLFLVAAEVDPSTGARASAAALVRVVGIDELWRSFPAALVVRVDPVLDAGAAVSADAVASAPPPWPEADCPRDATASLANALGSIDRPAILRFGSAGGGAPADGGDAIDPPANPQPPDAAHDFSRVGPLGRGDLLALADRVEAGTVSPAPRSAGDQCDADAAANWGAPLEPAGPCRDHFPVIYAPDGLHMAGGSGQGLLVVEGDLVLSGTARFFGAVYVLGTLTLRDDATIYGAVAVAGEAPARFEDHARIDYRACALWRAFTSAPALDRPFAPAGRSWVPSW